MKTPIAIDANKEQFQELSIRHGRLKGQTGVWKDGQTDNQTEYKKETERRTDRHTDNQKDMLTKRLTELSIELAINRRFAVR